MSKIPFPEELFEQVQKSCKKVPPLDDTHRFIDDMVNFLFPLRNDHQNTLEQTKKKWECLQDDLLNLLSPLEPFLEEAPDVLKERFFNAVPSIYKRSLSEAETFIRCDPAANMIEEVILCYPGFYAITIYRFANELYRMKIPVLPRAISEYAHSKTGIDIHPGATIGKNFYIDHGTGTVIGETTQIGNNVKIYQGVTLGALYVKRKLRHTKRHPTIEDDVIIYAGSTILGGDTVIGKNTIVGGNTWITESVAADSVVYHKAEVIIKDQRKEDRVTC